jgi:hypothetical protein
MWSVKEGSLQDQGVNEAIIGGLGDERQGLTKERQTDICKCLCGKVLEGVKNY